MATYYIDGGAAGGGDGSLSTPWNTIELLEAFDLAGTPGLVPGDTVKFKRGTTITSSDARFVGTHGGSAGNPITWTSYYNADGSDDASHDLPIIDCGCTNAITSAWLADSQGLTNVYISDYTGGTVWGMWEDLVFIPHADDIENIQPGEWWWNNSANSHYTKNISYTDGLYYRPSDDAVPATHSLKRGTSVIGIGFTDLEYLSFYNIHFKGGYTLLNITCSAAASANINGIIINGCEFSECFNAVRIRGDNAHYLSDCYLIDNVIYNAAQGLSCESVGDGAENNVNLTITGNTIFNINRSGKFSTYPGMGVFILDQEAIEVQNPSTVLIENNLLYNLGDTNQSTYGTGVVIWINEASGEFLNLTIRRNVIYDTIGAGIILGSAVGAPSSGGNLCYANLIYRCGTNGIKVNTASTNSYVFNNVIADCDIGVTSQSTCSGWGIANNIIYNNTSYHVFWNTSTNTSADNIFYPDGAALYSYNGADVTLSSWKTSVSDTTSIASDPFIGADYKPSLASPAKQAGSFVENTKDYAGNPFAIPPTIGAYEIVDVSSPVTMLSQSGVNMKTNIKTT